MTRKEYLESILTKQQIDDIQRAVNTNKPILIVGEQGTGKTTLLRYLEAFSNHVYEPENMLEVVLDKPLTAMDSKVLENLED